MLRINNCKFIGNCNLSNLIPKQINLSIIKQIEPFPEFSQIRIQNPQPRHFTIMSLQQKFENLIKKADSGDVDKQFELGNYYLKPTSAHQNSEKGLKYIKMAADNGHPIASYMYGVFLKNGVKVKSDLQQSEKYFTFAADNGVIDAQFELALEYYLGKSFAQNLPKSLHYFCLAAEKGNQIACETAGSFYLEGVGCEPNADKAMKYFKLGSELGSGVCKYQLSYLLQSNQSESIKLLKQAADAGYHQAQLEYGLMLLNHESAIVKYNEKEAEKYLRMAANQHDALASYELSALLGQSDKAIKRREGFTFLKRSADLEYPKAMVQYGKILCGEYDPIFGSISKIDRISGLNYLKAAADMKGSTPDSMMEYAKLLFLINQPKYETMANTTHDKEIEQYFTKAINKAKLMSSLSPKFIISYVEFLVSRKRNDDALKLLKANETLQDASIYYWIAYLGEEKAKYMKLSLCSSFVQSRAEDVELESIFNLNPDLKLTEYDIFPSFNHPDDAKQYFKDLKTITDNNPNDNLAKFKYAMLLFSGIGTDLDVCQCMHILESFSSIKPTNEINATIRRIALKIYSQWVLNNIDGNEKEFQIADLPAQICKEMADVNDTDCQYLYGLKKVFGSNYIVADKAQGIEYLEKAAKSGHKNASSIIMMMKK